jgi:hypothetical protein
MELDPYPTSLVTLARYGTREKRMAPTSPGARLSVISAVLIGLPAVRPISVHCPATQRSIR